jgi:hypothetical protein
MQLAIRGLESVEAFQGIGPPVHFQLQPKGMVSVKRPRAANIVRRELTIHVVAQRWTMTVAKPSKEALMKDYFSLSARDIGVMVGLGMFTGSAANVIWDLVFSSQIPSAVAIPIAFAGFVLGGVVSYRSGRDRHARN